MQVLCDFELLELQDQVVLVFEVWRDNESEVLYSDLHYADFLQFQQKIDIFGRIRTLLELSPHSSKYMAEDIVEHPKCKLVLVNHNRILQLTCEQTDNSLRSELFFQLLHRLELLPLLVILLPYVILQLHWVLCTFTDKHALSFLQRIVDRLINLKPHKPDIKVLLNVTLMVENRGSMELNQSSKLWTLIAVQIELLYLEIYTQSPLFYASW